MPPASALSCLWNVTCPDRASSTCPSSSLPQWLSRVTLVAVAKLLSAGFAADSLSIHLMPDKDSNTEVVMIKAF